MKKAAEEFVKCGTTEAMTARRDNVGPSRGSSTQPRFDRFLVIRVLLLLGFFVKKIFAKTSFLGLDFWLLNSLLVKLFDSRLFDR